tara:strand:- start:1806 stop:2159 length:354 start_codon:yes stop_codon:yes gene_type:complete
MQIERKTTNLKTGIVTIEMIDAPVDTTKSDPVAQLAAERDIMECTPMQGILTLGETEWGKVLTYRNQETTTWAQRQIIDIAQEWRRNSENVAFFQHLLQYTDEQVDALFRKAKQVEV